MSMISSKRQFGHVETINFRALKNRGMKLPEITFQAFKGATSNTRALVFYRYFTGIFYRYFTGKIFESYAAVILSVRNLLLCLCHLIQFTFI